LTGAQPRLGTFGGIRAGLRWAVSTLTAQRTMRGFQTRSCGNESRCENLSPVSELRRWSSVRVPFIARMIEGSKPGPDSSPSGRGCCKIWVELDHAVEQLQCLVIRLPAGKTDKTCPNRVNRKYKRRDSRSACPEPLPAKMSGIHHLKKQSRQSPYRQHPKR
jgi:hypothetical protein